MLTDLVFRQESFSFVAGPSQPKLYAWIFDYKTLGKDKLLGSGEVDVSSLALYQDLAFLTSLCRSGDTYNLVFPHRLTSSSNFAKGKDSCA